MGVYIEKMEMPKSCIACLLNFGEKRPEYGLTIYCPYSDGVIKWRDKAFDNGRLASCGIVPVPPHYDLIDHNALKIAVMDCDCETRVDFLKHTMDCINKAPVVIPSDMPLYGAEEGET